MTALRLKRYREAMADLRMPDGLSEGERQQWLEELRTQLIEETGQSHGVVEQQVPGEQPVWAMWGDMDVAPHPEAPDDAEPTHVPGLARTFDVPLTVDHPAPPSNDRPSFS